MECLHRREGREVFAAAPQGDAHTPVCYDADRRARMSKVKKGNNSSELRTTAGPGSAALFGELHPDDGA